MRALHPMRYNEGEKSGHRKFLLESLSLTQKKVALIEEIRVWQGMPLLIKMDIFTILVVGVCFIIVMALLLEPVAQRRREQAMFEQLKKMRHKSEAESTVEAMLQSNQGKTRLPEHWWDSYRFRNKIK